MPCTGRFAEATDYAAMYCLDVPLTADQTLMIETMLDITAADVHASMAASDQCSCALAAWATILLKKLNVIEVAIAYNCPCAGARLTDEAKQMWLNWMSEQLTAIRLGQLELCQGETGADWPARAAAEVAHTDWSEAEIIYHTEERALP